MKLFISYLLIILIIIINNSLCQIDDPLPTPKACQKGGDINVIPTLPHVNRYAASLPANLGDMQPVTAYGEDCSVGEDWCINPSFSELTTDPLNLYSSGSYTEDITHWGNYVDALIAWVAVGFVFGIFTIIGGCCFCCCRCCGRCGGGKFKEEDHRNSDGTLKRPIYEISLTYLTLIIFIVFMFAWMLSGQVNGNQGLTATQKAFVQAPNGVVNLAKGLPVPVEWVFSSLMGRSVNGLIGRTIDLFDEVIILDELHETVSCLEEALDIASDDTIPNFFVGVLDDMQFALNNNPLNDQVSEQLSSIDAKTKAIKPSVDTLLTQIAEFQSAIGNLSVAGIETAVSDLNVTLETLVPQLYGIRQIMTDYVSVQASMAETSTAIWNVLNISYTDTTLGIMNDSVHDLLNATINMPEEEYVAVSLENLNSTLNDAASDLDQLVSALISTQDQLSNIPDVTEVNNTLNEMLAKIDNITFDGFDAIFNDVEGLLDFIPDTDEIATTIDPLFSVVDKLPCILQINVFIQRINDSLLQIPSSFDFTDTVNSFNGTVVDGLDSLNTFKDLVGDLNETIADLGNATEAKDLLSTVEDSLQTARDSIVQLQQQVNDIGAKSDSASEYNLEPLINQTLATKDELLNSPAKMDASEVQAVRDLDGTRATTVNNTRLLVEALDGGLYRQNKLQYPTLYSKFPSIAGNIQDDFYCVDTPNAFNTPSLYKCYDHDDDGGVGAQGVTPLIRTSTSCAQLVSSDSVCSFPYEALYSTVLSIDKFNRSINTLPVRLDSGVIDGIDASIASIESVDFDGYGNFSQLAKLQADVKKYDDDIGDTKSQIDEVLDRDFASLGDEILDVDTLLGNFTNDIDTYRDAIEGFNGTLGDAVDSFDYFFTLEENIYNLAKFDIGPLLETMDNETLFTEIYDGNGLAGAFDRVANVVDEVAARFDIPSPLGAADDITGFIQLFDVMADRDNSIQSQGSIHYLISIQAIATSTGALGRRLIKESGLQNIITKNINEYFEENGINSILRQGNNFNRMLQAEGGLLPSNIDLTNLLSNDDVSDCDTPTLFGCYSETEGTIENYESGGACFTDNCLNNFIDVFNTKPIPGLNTVVGVDVPVSRETAMFLPFLAPLIIIMISLLVLFVPKCGPLLTCCTLCSSACLFIFVGGLSWPLIMIVGDVCANVESVSATAIDAIEPAICPLLAEGSSINSNDFCEVNLVTPVITWTFELDASELFRSLTVTCEGRSLANTDDGVAVEPLEQLWVKLEEQATTIADEQLNLILSEQAGDLNLRERLLDSLLESVPDLSDDIRILAVRLADAVGCESVSLAYLGFKDTMCCDLFGSFYWWGAAFYLMAFTMLCCGCPAGALAHSRLRGTKITEIAKLQVAQTRNQVQQFREDVRENGLQETMGKSMRNLGTKMRGNNYADDGDYAVAQPISVDVENGGGHNSFAYESVGAAENSGLPMPNASIVSDDDKSGMSVGMISPAEKFDDESHPL